MRCLPIGPSVTRSSFVFACGAQYAAPGQATASSGRRRLLHSSTTASLLDESPRPRAARGAKGRSIDEDYAASPESTRVLLGALDISVSRSLRSISRLSRASCRCRAMRSRRRESRSRDESGTASGTCMSVARPRCILIILYVYIVSEW